MALMKHGTSIVAAAAAFGLACGGSSSSPQRSENALERLRWEAAGIDRYTLDQEVVCFCPSEANVARLTVVAGDVVDLVDADTGEPVPSELAGLYYTVDQLFDLVDDANARGAATLEVDYDSALRFPASVVIDYDRSVADEELAVFSSNLVSLRE